MASPSKVRAALGATNRAQRIRLMADTMRHHQAGPEGGCTDRHLAAAGFSAAEIEAYADPARERLRGTPPVVVAPSPARMEGVRLVRQAQAVRRRLSERGAL